MFTVDSLIPYEAHLKSNPRAIGYLHERNATITQVNIPCLTGWSHTL